ncbi:MAG: rRNA pseudouridine synthase [Verrucomicrobia bacterium]|nr:rRNA pseudouridine synthase [Verrucomicrobiota bacterium]MBI3870976.1 rRNA pseudouridine synthase [Verrucomicrobiota bacterium]
MMVRLQKFMAECGVASRRASETLITEGRVRVNGQLVQELGKKIRPGEDEVTVDGAKVRAKKKLYIALNKPRRYLCTRQDPSRRRTVMELLPAEWDSAYPVGRLDYESEGLLFLTNDGDFALRLTHPRYGVTKIYEAIVDGRVTPQITKRIVRGVESEGEMIKAVAARVLDTSETQSIVRVELSEGKNREVRRLFSACGLEVEQLVRTQIGPIKLGELPSGKWRTLTEPEIKSLLPRT